VFSRERFPVGVLEVGVPIVLYLDDGVEFSVINWSLTWVSR